MEYEGPSPCSQKPGLVDILNHTRQVHASIIFLEVPS